MFKSSFLEHFWSGPGNQKEKRLGLELVLACYRQILGREPENKRVLRDQVKSGTPESILEQFLTCDEFRASPLHHNSYHAGKIDEVYTIKPRTIDVSVEPDILNLMFERIRKEWEKLGETEPYWSVLTQPDFLKENMNDKNLDAFFESGQSGSGSGEMLELFYKRNFLEPPKGICLELGCGVGRVTLYLARFFERVIAVDVSSGNLEICRKIAAEKNINNIEFILLKSPDDIQKLPNFDLFFSMIVLQHNPPPVQYFILNSILNKLNINGGAFFQLPTHVPGYEFRASEYLSKKAEGMEMHCIPMSAVFKSFAAHDITPIEVITDNWTGSSGSHTFFGIKN